jgi:hypothetical protein
MILAIVYVCITIVTFAKNNNSAATLLTKVLLPVFIVAVNIPNGNWLNWLNVVAWAIVVVMNVFILIKVSPKKWQWKGFVTMKLAHYSVLGGIVGFVLTGTFVNHWIDMIPGIIIVVGILVAFVLDLASETRFPSKH